MNDDEAAGEELEQRGAVHVRRVMDLPEKIEHSVADHRGRIGRAGRPLVHRHAAAVDEDEIREGPPRVDTNENPALSHQHSKSEDRRDGS